MSKTTIVQRGIVRKEAVTLKLEGRLLTEVVDKLKAVLDEYPSHLSSVELTHTSKAQAPGGEA